jgi:hypothetical protein
MDIHEELNSLRSQTLERVRAAAQRGHADEVLTQGRTLSRIEELIKQHEALGAAVRALSGGSTNGQRSKTKAATAVEPAPRDSEPEMSPRQRGKYRRQELLTYLEQKGVHLKPFRGAIRRTRSGQRVGTAYASERRPDRWFLGLPEDEFDHAILLCEGKGGSVHYLFISQGLLRTHAGAMSRSQGQLKFNVSHRDGDFFLIVPGSDPVKIPSLDQEINQLV